ncbi:HWE histidine kinase domain-containing protein [Steroidobacter sp.]|uniref:HWE histidine kinase domain-containing protein n=1 Tax=Steroidobacter sp. TaxID=1978227 RepID=UPI001A61AF54|nr:HWE histidine kinase domain-containing protein [Steroidobacter sp.]MBL8270563.1 hypothetical protein [Steroidobacter sp.]
MMTSANTADSQLSARLHRELKLIANARSIDAVLLATATAARELTGADGLCVVPTDRSAGVIATVTHASIPMPDGNSSLQRLILSAVDSGEAIVQQRASLTIELPQGRRLFAETLLTVPLGTESGYSGLAFFWRDGTGPSAQHLALLPALAWTARLALQAQLHEGELRQCRSEHRSQARELQHRARNVLALVRSIIRHTGQNAESAEEFAAYLEARISATARMQALTIDAHTGPELEDLVRAELTAHAVPERQVVIAGPALRLTPRAAGTMALAFHELTTNALKFGALTVPHGQIAVKWDIVSTPAPTLRWRWLESNASIAETTPKRRGFGRELIEHVLPYELDAVTRFSITPEGARCEIELPIDERSTVPPDLRDGRNS